MLLRRINKNRLTFLLRVLRLFLQRKVRPVSNHWHPRFFSRAIHRSRNGGWNVMVIYMDSIFILLERGRSCVSRTTCMDRFEGHPSVMCQCCMSFTGICPCTVGLRGNGDKGPRGNAISSFKSTKAIAACYSGDTLLIAKSLLSTLWPYSSQRE